MPSHGSTMRFSFKKLLVGIVYLPRNLLGLIALQGENHGAEVDGDDHRASVGFRFERAFGEQRSTVSFQLSDHIKVLK